MKTGLELGRGEPSPVSVPAPLLPSLLLPSLLLAQLGAGRPGPHASSHPLSWLTRGCLASPFPRLGRTGAQELVPVVTILPTLPAPAGFQVRGS